MKTPMNEEAFLTAQRFYNDGIWSKPQLFAAIDKLITYEQYEQIINEKE